MPKRSRPPKPNAPAELSKFWEEGPTLLDLFDGYPESQKERLAIYDYEHGSAELLSKLVMERTGQVLSPELATFLSRIVGGEKPRMGKAGRPRGSAQDDPLTRSRIYARIVRWKASGMSLESAYIKIAKLAGRTPRVIRQYYEEFKNPPPMKPPRTPAPTK
jgi:hypothetical protein